MHELEMPMQVVRVQNFIKGSIRCLSNLIPELPPMRFA